MAVPAEDWKQSLDPLELREGNSVGDEAEAAIDSAGDLGTGCVKYLLRKHSVQEIALLLSV